MISSIWARVRSALKGANSLGPDYEIVRHLVHALAMLGLGFEALVTVLLMPMVLYGHLPISAFLAAGAGTLVVGTICSAYGAVQLIRAARLIIDRLDGAVPAASEHIASPRRD
jgi:hypothetical protein